MATEAYMKQVEDVYINLSHKKYPGTHSVEDFEWSDLCEELNALNQAAGGQDQEIRKTILITRPYAQADLN
jgi:hypothetical protein